MELLNLTEAASYIKCKPSTLRNNLAVKVIPTYKLFRKFYFEVEDLDKYIKSQRVEPVKAPIFS